MTEPAAPPRMPHVLAWLDRAPIGWVASRSAYPWIVVMAAGIGSFVGQASSSLSQLALPHLEEYFGAPIDVVSWVSVASLLAMAALLPIFGHLADRWGEKPLAVMGFLFFAVGALLGGSADSIGVLIGARLIQGIGAAMLSATATVIIVHTVSVQQRGRALGMQVTMQSAGLALGMVFGGAIIDYLGWRWAFLAMVPMGLLAMLLTWLVLPRSESKGGAAFDWLGAGVLIAAITTCLFAINQVGRWGIGSPLVWGSALAAIILGSFFVRHTRRAADPIVELRLLGDRVFRVQAIVLALGAFALFSVYFIMPFAFERALGRSATIAGLCIAALAVLQGAISPISGAISDKVGAHVIGVTGTMITVVGLLLLYAALDGRNADLFAIVGALAVIGLGRGLFNAPNRSIMMSRAPDAGSGGASGLIGLAQMGGMSLGIAATTGFVSWRLRSLPGGTGTTMTAPPEDLLMTFRMVILIVAGITACAGVLLLLFGGTGKAKKAEVGGR